MESPEIRNKFIQYFEKHGHKHISSSSLVPANDPTLLFTNAGMVQFKDVFLGKEEPKYKRAVTCQRCLRAGGKHNDLENVGYTTRHHTFFEMLGNFSFGDYFKKEAIHFAWDFLTNKKSEGCLEIDPQRLWVTVHKKDKEAQELWENEFKESGKHAQGIGLCGDEDNFWAMGETGPCGYCSEIFYDHGDKLKGGKPGAPDEGGERYVEIWNLVFMQFERDSKGNLTELAKKSVDTGMGLERIAAVMQGTHDNYQTSDFKELTIKALPTHETFPGPNNRDIAIANRVIADHIRASIFLIADGILPSNEGRGYVLRSILRRAIYHLYICGIKRPFLQGFLQRGGNFADGVIDILAMYNDVYPELEKKRAEITSVITREEKQFLETLERGVKILDQELSKIKTKVIPGNVVFYLHDTYGFPSILTAEIAKKRGFTIDQAGFEVEMDKQRERSRAASKFSTKGEFKLDISGATKFVDYEQLSSQSKILHLLKCDGSKTESLETGEAGLVVLDQTPFYAESGGQVGDIGYLATKDHFQFKVTNTQKHGALFLHEGIVECGNFAVGITVEAKVDEMRRTAIKLNHSSAHLLHKALQKVLGEHATQRGSLVDAEKLRFDFAHFSAVTPEELLQIENIVNTAIRADLEVATKIKSLEDARKEGVVALFGEKYGENVRVVKMGDFSQELCGGTHVKHTGEIGVFKITSESGVAAGIRRIEAVTGENALSLFQSFETQLARIANILKCNHNQIFIKLEQIFSEKRAQEKELTRLTKELAGGKGKDLAGLALKINNVNVLATKIDAVDIKNLRQTVDMLKQQLEPAIIALATISDNKIQLLVGVSKTICEKYKANELLQHIAKQIDGSGGGRADMAQGGGTNLENLDVALKSVATWVSKH